MAMSTLIRSEIYYDPDFYISIASHSHTLYNASLPLSILFTYLANCYEALE
jgi:hypothetical protein